MKNVFYISGLNFDQQSGVNKKIMGQINAFNNIGKNTSYVGIKEGKIYYFHNGDAKYIEDISKNKIIKKMQIINASIKIIKKSNDIDVIYIRYLFSTPQTIRLLKIAKKKNIKIIEEIPTYPYDKELKNGRRIDLKLVLMVDKHYRKKIKKYVSKIATFSDDKTIYGIETINIDNGINVDNIRPIDIQYDDKTVNMIAVSSMEYWQGYDRIIKSLKNYYEQKKEEEPEIIIHLVGDGGEIKNLKGLVKKLGLENNVVFYGFLSGKELEDVYDKSQCAIGGLGIFRKNIKKCRTLKVREYTAKAIPFIYSTIDDSITNFKYAYKVPDNEEIFDMRSVLEFLESLDKNVIKQEMREFAEKNYKWEYQMKKVLEEININGDKNAEKSKRLCE